MIAIEVGLRSAVEHFENALIPYMIVGSIPCAIYGDPRLTRDLDLVIKVDAHVAAVFVDRFSPEHFYIPPHSIMIQEFSRRGQFNLLHHASGLKIDCMIQKNTPHGLAEFERRRRLTILPDLDAWVAAPEDIIIAKMRFFREGESEKHLRDIRGVLAQTPVDRVLLQEWVNLLGLQAVWAKI